MTTNAHLLADILPICMSVADFYTSSDDIVAFKARSGTDSFTFYHIVHYEFCRLHSGLFVAEDESLLTVRGVGVIPRLEVLESRTPRVSKYFLLQKSHSVLHSNFFLRIIEIVNWKRRGLVFLAMSDIKMITHTIKLGISSLSRLILVRWRGYDEYRRTREIFCVYLKMLIFALVYSLHYAVHGCVKPLSRDSKLCDPRLAVKV